MTVVMNVVKNVFNNPAMSLVTGLAVRWIWGVFEDLHPQDRSLMDLVPRENS
jgi:hypothetical protein